MTEAPLNNPSANTVDLAEDEFQDVYKLLKMCLASEMGIDVDAVPDGEPFVKSCQHILSTGENADESNRVA